MSQKFYLNLLKVGIFSSLVVVFFVFKGLLFPFITSKQISFNVIMEILVPFWLAFVVKYPAYRPKWSFITIGLLAFFAAITVTCFTGVDFNLSFWGDVERMLGVFHVLHFLIFYFIIITVMRSWQDWKFFLSASVVCAVIFSIKAIAGNPYGTIGNTAYVAGYLIFNIYFSVLLFLREKHDLRWLYILALPLFFLAFKGAGSSGGYVGLVFGIFLAVFLYAVLNKNKKTRVTAWSLLLIGVVSLGVLFASRDSKFVQQSEFLLPVAEISFQKNTFQTRLISWRAAFQDFKNHPVLGVGFGNYAIVFDKYFDPTFYDHTRAETYFDRAHNNLVDILSTSGLLGLLSYLSIFIAIAYYMIRGYRDGKLGINEFALLSGLFAAYFVQNLAVFDSLVTYMALMISLGIVYWFYYIGEGDFVSPVKVKESSYSTAEVYSLLFSGVVILVITFQYNIKPYQMLVGTIKGQQAYAQGNVEEADKIYRETLAMNTVLDRDSRTSHIRSLLSTDLLKLDEKSRKNIMDFAIDAAEKNVVYNPGDSMNQMVLAQVLNTTSGFYQGHPDEFAHYSDRALAAIDKSIAASPGRIPVYYQKAQIYITRGEKEKAIETLKYALSLNKKYYDSQCYLVRAYGFYGDINEEYYQYLDECVDLGGAELFSSADFIKASINYYVGKKDWDKSLKLYTRLAQLSPSDADVWIKLSNLYKQMGDMENSQAAAQKAAELNPKLKKYLEEE